MKTLNFAERNYNICDREFLGLIFELTYCRHLLSGTKQPVKVFVDHTNLLHYQHPQKINRRIARYILTLVDYRRRQSRYYPTSSISIWRTRAIYGPRHHSGRVIGKEPCPLRTTKEYPWLGRRQWSMEERRTYSCSNQRHQGRNSEGTSQSSNGQTPGCCYYLLFSKNQILVAKNEGMDSTIRQRMWSMSTKQDQHTPDKTTPLPNYPKVWSKTIRNSHNGLNHETTTVNRI